MVKVEYFDEKVEMASRKVLENIQLNKLKDLLNKVYQSNPFYIRKSKEHGVSLEDIKTIGDIVKLPFASKIEFQEEGSREK